LAREDDAMKKWLIKMAKDGKTTVMHVVIARQHTRWGLGAGEFLLSVL
jgi:hypothetical protein